MNEIGEKRLARFIWRPVLGFDLAYPLKEVVEVIKLFFIQIELGHLPAPFDTARLRFHPGFNRITRSLGILVPAITHKDISEFWRKIGAFPQYRMAIDASVLFPDALAMFDFSG